MLLRPSRQTSERLVIEERAVCRIIDMHVARAN